MENTGQSILLNLFAEPAQPVKSQSFSRSKDSDDNGEKFNDHLAALGEGEQFVNAEGAPPIGEDFDAFGNPVSVENIRGQNGFALPSEGKVSLIAQNGAATAPSAVTLHDKPGLTASNGALQSALPGNKALDRGIDTAQRQPITNSAFNDRVGQKEIDLSRALNLSGQSDSIKTVHAAAEKPGSGASTLAASANSNSVKPEALNAASVFKDPSSVRTADARLENIAAASLERSLPSAQNLQTVSEKLSARIEAQKSSHSNSLSLPQTAGNGALKDPVMPTIPTQSNTGFSITQNSSADGLSIEITSDEGMDANLPRRSFEGSPLEMRASSTALTATAKTATIISQTPAALQNTVFDNLAVAAGEELHSLSTISASSDKAPITPSAIQTTAAVQGSAAWMQVVSAIADRQGDSRLELRLNPPELGRVIIGFEGTGTDIVRAVVSAESPETLDLMRRNIDILQRELARSGLEDVNVELSDRDTRTDSDSADENDAVLAASNIGEDDAVLAPINRAADGRLDLLV